MPTVTIGGKQDLLDAILVDDEGDGVSSEHFTMRLYADAELIVLSMQERYIWRLPPFRPTLYLFWDYHSFPFEVRMFRDPDARTSLIPSHLVSSRWPQRRTSCHLHA